MVDTLSQRLLDSDDESHQQLVTDETQMLDVQLDSTPSYSLKDCFRYAALFDKLLFIGGMTSAFVFGGITPMTIQIVGKMLGGTAGANPQSFADQINKYTPQLLELGGLSFVTGYLQTFLLSVLAERLLREIKRECLKSLLRQEVSYFDTESIGSLSTLFAQQTQNLLKGISDSFGQGIQSFSMMFVSFYIGFQTDISIAEMLMTVVPVLMVLIAVMIVILTKRNKQLDQVNEEGGGLAEELLGAIQTVASFGGEDKSLRKYETLLCRAEKIGVFIGTFMGCFIMFFFVFLYSMFGASYWYGSSLIADGKSDFGKVYTTVFSCTMGAMSVVGLVPCFQGIAKATIAVKALFKVIDRQPKFNNGRTSKHAEESISGPIEFKDVAFKYPNRDNLVLSKVSFIVSPGQTCALVGQSGCGKSTCIQLLERFYDPLNGSVQIGGVNINRFDLKYLRNRIALVGQEPVLFAKSVRENIWLGMPGPIDDSLVMEAAIKANAHEFVTAFKDGYETQCGSMGTQLSGGQKQRIAIARALVRRPRIMLLDEATSALDYESERVVQKSIDDLLATTSMTTIIIAHRLSTIRRADNIIVFAKEDLGAVVAEQGTHEELMEQEGSVYRRMVEMGGEIGHESLPLVEPSSPSLTWGLTRSISLASSSLDLHSPLIESQLDRQQSFIESSEEPLYHVERSRLWAETRKYFKLVVLGIISAGLAGGTNPLTSIILSNAMKGFVIIPSSISTHICSHDNDCTVGESCYHHGNQSLCATFFPDHGPEDVKQAGSRTFLMYLAIGIFMGVARGVNVGSFMYISHKLTHNIKHKMFGAYMRMDATYYDQPKNQIGVLVAKLATDPILVQNVTGDYWGQLMTNLFGVLVAFAIAFQASLKFTLVVIVPCSLFALSTFLNIRRDAQRKVALELESGKILNQALNSVRTVYSCNAEEEVLLNYEEFLRGALVAGIRNSNMAALSNGFAQFAIQGVISFSYWYGGKMLVQGTLSPGNLFKVVNALQAAGQSVGATFARANDTSKADVAISNIYSLLDDKRAIDYSRMDGLTTARLLGNITFQNVSFAYPTRKKTKVLDNFSCSIYAGQTVAFVGSSGSGKSSIIKLLERFYDADEGQILLDGSPLAFYNLAFLRSQIGLVGQEPILFGGTIKENVLYGVDSDDLELAMDACKRSNAHDFILDFPNGYDTVCGAKGGQLSGGQKQRIAIARALLRNPSILLLDEATSALDNESEHLVQEALELMMSGRTTITVAHRLATIQHADQIIVMDKGKIVELGTHEDLMVKRGGRYKQLYEFSSGYNPVDKK